MIVPFVLVSLAVLAPPSLAARNPSYARDGRLAVSIDGDLWVGRSAAGPWTRVTSGPEWDRAPAWTADGASIVFASDRDASAGGLGGDFRLWRVRVTASGPATAPVRVTSGREREDEPTLAPDGRIAFVRGSDRMARLWLRLADGTERRVTKRESPERSPAFSSDGARLAYVAGDEGAERLRVHWMASGADSVVIADRAAEHPAWSPSGDRLAFTVGGARPGVYVAPADGRFANLLSARHAEPAWSSDGRTIAMATIVSERPSYNGDPDRLHDPERDVSELLRGEGGLATIDAPPPLEASLATRTLPTAGARAERNLEAFDRAWSRSASLYFAGAAAAPRRAQWERIRERYRPTAREAPSDSALDEVIHRMLVERPPLREAATGRAAVSSAHPVATEAGLSILRKGGNVVDAAVAVSFALGVVEPDASGVGGYGQMVVRLAGMEKPALIEFMARVPEDASLHNGALLQNGRYPEDGPTLAIVPGTVAGMHTAWKRYGSGRMPWADLLAPAIHAAKEGYVVSEGLATTLATEREHFLKYEGSRALFFHDRKPLAVGDTIRNADLAWVLEQIAARGADGFYRGAVAERLVHDLRGKGNAVRLTDLARYYAAEREPVRGTYRGYTLYSSAPPVSGGASLVAELNLLEQWPTPRPYAEDAATLHAMIAAWQLVPSARNRIADPGLWPVDVGPFVSKDTARQRWRCFDASRAIPATAFRGDTLACAGAGKAAPASGARPGEPGGGGVGREVGDGAGGPPRREGTATGATPTHPFIAAVSAATQADLEPAPGCDDDHAREVARCHSTGTTAFAVADADGNAVAVTQTLGTWGGNFYVSPGLGFLYNDKLTSYGTDPSQYGARLPNARHGSTLAPTLVFEGTGAAARPILAVGAAGNAWITSAVYQTLVGVVDQKLDAQRALELPRFLISGRGFGPGARRDVTVEMEDGFAPAVLRRLRAMGYRLDMISLPGELRMGYGAAIVLGSHEVTAGADPRRAGAAGAIR